jgi:hypothetical protein
MWQFIVSLFFSFRRYAAAIRHNIRITRDSSSLSSNSDIDPENILDENLTRCENDELTSEDSPSDTSETESNHTENDYTESNDGSNQNNYIHEDPLGLEDGDIYDLMREWMLLQMGHNCSTEVSNNYFDFCWEYCHVFLRIKQDMENKRSASKELRKNVMRELIPTPLMDYFFQDPNDMTKEIHVMNREKFPKSEYPPSEFKLLGQITKLRITDIVNVHARHVVHNEIDPHVIISIDGVNETKSTSRSLRIVSMKFRNCYEVYPCIIFRPEVFQKKRLSPYFNAHLEVFLEECIAAGLHPYKAILDAPERAACRGQKQHGAYYSCDVCLANPDNYQSPGTQKYKRVFRPHHANAEQRTHANTIIWAQQSLEEGRHVFGITGQSVFSIIPDFDLIKDIPPEPMHLMDTGFMKNTCLKIFNAGSSPQCKDGYRRTPIGKLSDIIR